MTIDAITTGPRTCAITYLSQCLPLRHDDASAEGTYPFVAQRYVEAARPGLRVTTTVVPYVYPYDTDLGFKFDLVVRERPDVVVLEVPARPIAYGGTSMLDLRRFPSHVRSAHQRFRYLRELNDRVQLPRPLGQLVHLVDVSLRGVLAGPLRSVVRRLPTPSPEEYEAIVDETISRLAARKETALILSGPAGFSDAGGGNGYVHGSPRLYDAVNEMVRRIAVRNGLPFVDRVAVAAEGGRDFFLPGSSIHYSASAHRQLGRLLGDTLVKLGVS